MSASEISQAIELMRVDVNYGLKVHHCFGAKVHHFVAFMFFSVLIGF
jgi:hypothetical protein